MKTKYLFTGLLLLAVTLFIVTCSKSSYNNGSGGSGGGANSTTITISNMAYSTPNLQVKAGTKVTWVNNDNMTHTVTSDNNSFDSGDMGYGATFSYTFSATGTYAYHCKYHPMTGVVVVVAQ